VASKNWIQKAIGKPGTLHKALGVPLGQKIPAAKIEAVTHSKNKKLAAEARLAQTLAKINRKK